MSERIDVLAVMDAVIEGMGGPTDLGLSEARAAVAELVDDLKRIQRRAAAHPDDDDADRKRNLYHCESIARAALARIAPNELHDMAAELRGRTDG